MCASRMSQESCPSSIRRQCVQHQYVCTVDSIQTDWPLLVDLKPTAESPKECHQCQISRPVRQKFRYSRLSVRKITQQSYSSDTTLHYDFLQDSSSSISLSTSKVFKGRACLRSAPSQKWLKQRNSFLFFFTSLRCGKSKSVKLKEIVPGDWFSPQMQQILH